MMFKFQILAVLLLFQIKVFSQEIYNEIFVKSDSIIKNEIAINKKFLYKDVISISDNKGNILIFNDKKGVKFSSGKKLKKSSFKIKNKSEILDLFSSQLLSMSNFENDKCDSKIRECIYLKVSLFDEKQSLKVSKSFFIPFGKIKTDENLENLISIYFDEIQ